VSERLTNTELLFYDAIRNADGRVVSPRELVSLVYGGHGSYQADSIAVRTHVFNLRRKLGHEEAGRIRSAWGAGYYFAVEEIPRVWHGPVRNTAHEMLSAQSRVQAMRR